MTLGVLLLALQASAWVELPFHGAVAKNGPTPTELSYPPGQWTTLDVELEAGGKVRLAYSTRELALLSGAALPSLPVACEAISEPKKLGLPGPGDLNLHSEPSPGAKGIRCDWLAVSLEKGGKKGSLFMRPDALTEAPHAGAKLTDWKLLGPRALVPMMVWQKKSLVVTGRELQLTDLETGKTTKVTLEREIIDIACATLSPLKCAAVFDTANLVLVDGDKKTPVEGFVAEGSPEGLDMSPDGERVAMPLVLRDNVAVGIYRRSTQAWVRHALTERKIIDVGRFSDDPPGFVITVDPKESLLLSLDEPKRKSVPRTGPSWTSPLGKKLEQRAGAAWLHVPGADSKKLDWAKLESGPNAWLGEDFVLSGGANVAVLDFANERTVPLIDPHLKLGRVFPCGDDPTWLVVLRPDGAWRVRLAL